MIRRFVVALVALLGLTTQSALAIPGQTPAQLLAWGKSNAALPGFKPTMDENTGGTVYMARLKIDGLDADFSSEPTNGVARQEYISFQGVGDPWNLSKHMSIARDAIRTVYGADYLADFTSAKVVPLHGRVVAWQGKRLAYSIFGGAIFMIRNADFPAVLKNIHTCDGIDCED